AEEVVALGRRAVVAQTDVTSRADLRAMVDRAKADLGRIDILVNNAGIYRAAATLDVTEEHWDAIMTINAKAVFFATQAVLPAMLAQKRGSIVSLASMAGKIGSKTNLPYNARRAAVGLHDRPGPQRRRRSRHALRARRRVTASSPPWLAAIRSPTGSWTGRGSSRTSSPASACRRCGASSRRISRERRTMPCGW